MSGRSNGNGKGPVACPCNGDVMRSELERIFGWEKRKQEPKDEPIKAVDGPLASDTGSPPCPTELT